MRWAEPNIDSYVQGFPLHHAANFSLRVLELVMETVQRSVRRSGVVDLNQGIGDSQLGELCAVVGLHEKTPGVTDDLWAQLARAG